MAEWKVVGQVGTIIKKNKYYIVNIAENKYKQVGNITEKESTLWFNCISQFKPKAEEGDKVIAEGIFEESKNSDFQFALKITHIGIIKKKK